MKTTTFDAQRVAPYLLFAILIVLSVVQADSTSLDPQYPGTVFSGRNRMLRKLPSPPPPQVPHFPHYKFPCPPPPPPSALHVGGIYSSFRTVRGGSPPAPKPNRPRNFRIFLSPPPSPPPPPPPPPPARVYRRRSKCTTAPPPPESG